jgi:hypothetical protein
MDLCNFALLSLNDMIAPNIAELPVIIQTIQQQNEHIDIINIQTIKELFINLYLSENPNITFEELQEKLIRFYFEEANEELISRHLNNIYDILPISVIVHIHEAIMNCDYNENLNLFNLNALIKFISIPEGIEYLQYIYNIYCVMII